MKALHLLFETCLALLTACAPKATQIPVYAWHHWEDSTTAETLDREFALWASHGVTGICYNPRGFHLDRIQEAARVAKKHDLEFHAWLPTLTQEGRDSTWYTVNRLGESAYDKPVYVPYYTTLDPNNPAVVEWLCQQYAKVAEIPEVDYVQLDYIRYADVILAKGLWEKYGLTMNEEYPKADYCYCDHCVADYKQRTGIDIRTVSDPSTDKAWAQYRCDAVTRCVNAIAEAVHAKGKKVSADVFPGPKSHAEWMVRQQWQNWQVDALFPMLYNDFYLEPAEWVETMTREGVAAVADKRTPIYAGLFICRDWRNKHKVVDPENSGLLPSEIGTAVHGAMRAGAKGISLFIPTNMTPEHWEAFDKALHDWKP